MARIPEAEIGRLKEAVPVARLIEASGVELKKGGKDLLGRCPFHEDATASLVARRSCRPPTADQAHRRQTDVAPDRAPSPVELGRAAWSPRSHAAGSRRGCTCAGGRRCHRTARARRGCPA
ncbi:MAG: hypothetical protein JNL30_18035 [Rubrivivax sp.]|nr:hypothetical protein [Rubrivivax sp.]